MAEDFKSGNSGQAFFQIVKWEKLNLISFFKAFKTRYPGND